jgi:adenosylmethionine-8-amino-7-oxononanoate aminotransferase
MLTHGITFGGHPVSCAVALKNLEIMERDGIVTGVAEHEDAFEAELATLLELDIVGDLRGAGYMWALELVKDQERRAGLAGSEQTATRAAAGFSAEEAETLLRGFLSPELYERGLICRADDRGDPVVQISPPLVARQQEFSEIVGILGDVLAEAWKRIS